MLAAITTIDTEDTANKSYEVDLNIPVSCAKYKIELVNNVSNLTLKSGLTTKMLNGKLISKEINNTEEKITITMKFTADQGYLFNYILDRADITIDELCTALDAANNFFTEYEISRQSQNVIDKYIGTLGRYEKTWNGLTTKPDYNLTLFRGRILPYFNIECKDWVKANIEALKGDYPSEIVRASMKRTAVTDDFDDEISAANRNNNFLEWKILPIEKYPDMSKLLYKITTLIKLGLVQQAIIMTLRLLISPKECHIIKSPVIWKWLSPIMAGNSALEEVVRYCCNYAMYILRQEETVMFSQVNLKYRVLFSLEEASSLPTFYISHIEKSPYILQLTDGSNLVDTIPFYLQGNRSINDKTEFDCRFHIATGGAFTGVDFRKIGAAITGSILIPCVQKSSLENGFEDAEWVREREGIELKYPYMIDTPETPADIAFANFLEYYYPSYVSLKNDDFKTQVLGIEPKIKTIVKLVDEEDTTHQPSTVDDIKYEDPDEVTVTQLDVTNSESKEDMKGDTKEDTHNSSVEMTDTSNLTTVPLLSTNKVLREEDSENKTQRVGVDYNQLADVDISITTRDQETFKTRALELYNTICKNCNHRGPVHIKEIKTLASVKYKVYGPGIPRPMDIFRIPYDPAKMVKKFHVHAVKMFYDGDITLFRSCVACLLGGVGESYKWFSCNKVAADVLLKYAQRGMSIILNERERVALSTYIKDSDRWGSMLETLKIPTEKIYCSVGPNHPFFRPGLYDCGCRKGLRMFERDTNSIYFNKFVVPKPKNIFPFGEVRFKDGKKIYAPNVQTILAGVNYYINGEYDTSNDNDGYDNDADSDDE